MARECYRLAPAGSKVTFLTRTSSFLDAAAAIRPERKMAEASGDRSRFHGRPLSIRPFWSATYESIHMSVLNQACLSGRLVSKRGWSPRQYRVEMSVASPPFGRATQFCQHAFHRSVLLAAYLHGPMFPLDMPREFLIPQSLTKNSCVHSSFHCHFFRGYLSHVVMSSVRHANPSHRIASSGLEFCSQDNADVGFMISLMQTNLEPRKY
jgi:hypothetical protein